MSSGYQYHAYPQYQPAPMAQSQEHLVFQPQNQQSRPQVSLPNPIDAEIVIGGARFFRDAIWQSGNIDLTAIGRLYFSDKGSGSVLSVASSIFSAEDFARVGLDAITGPLYEVRGNQGNSGAGNTDALSRFSDSQRQLQDRQQGAQRANVQTTLYKQVVFCYNAVDYQPIDHVERSMSIKIAQLVIDHEFVKTYAQLNPNTNAAGSSFSRNANDPRKRYDTTAPCALDGDIYDMIAGRIRELEAWTGFDIKDDGLSTDTVYLNKRSPDYQLEFLDPEYNFVRKKDNPAELTTLDPKRLKWVNMKIDTSGAVDKAQRETTPNAGCLCDVYVGENKTESYSLVDMFNTAIHQAKTNREMEGVGDGTNPTCSVVVSAVVQFSVTFKKVENANFNLRNSQMPNSASGEGIGPGIIRAKITNMGYKGYIEVGAKSGGNNAGQEFLGTPVTVITARRNQGAATRPYMVNTQQPPQQAPPQNFGFNQRPPVQQQGQGFQQGGQPLPAQPNQGRPPQQFQQFGMPGGQQGQVQYMPQPANVQQGYGQQAPQQYPPQMQPQPVYTGNYGGPAQQFAQSTPQQPNVPNMGQFNQQQGFNAPPSVPPPQSASSTPTAPPSRPGSSSGRPSMEESKTEEGAPSASDTDLSGIN